VNLLSGYLSPTSYGFRFDNLLVLRVTKICPEAKTISKVSVSGALITLERFVQLELNGPTFGFLSEYKRYKQFFSLDGVYA